MKGVVEGFRELQHVPQGVRPRLPETGHCARVAASQSLGYADFGGGVTGQTAEEAHPGDVGEWH